ncbi:MAG: hypothetical protein LBB17_02810 [Puniceicoccales bacterium]|jgi:hypothetical protein|nr:hypothetical protein [Puniceicoccales bacterium]
MDGIMPINSRFSDGTFIDISHRGAVGVRSVVDQKSKKPRFDWYQRTYANTKLRKQLTQHMLLALGKYNKSTLNQINRLLDGKLHDTELLGLSEKIGDLIGQLSVSSPQRNALVALLNYVDAQGSIALGYTEDILAPKTPGGDVVPAIGWPLWSVPYTGFSTWGVSFAERVKYVSSRGGDITFMLSESGNGHTFTAQGAFTTYCIWKEVLRQVNSVDPSPDYQSILSDIVTLKILSKINDYEDLKILYAYHVFRNVYGACNAPESPIATTFIDKPTIDAHIKDVIEALDRQELPQDGATSYFEFAYLLCSGTKFAILATDEKVRSFVDFSTDEQDPDQEEFRDKIKTLMAPTRTSAVSTT